MQIRAHLAVSGIELPLWAYKCTQELWQSGDLGHQHDCCVLLLTREWNYATKSLPHCCVCCLCPDGLTQHVLPLQFQVELWVKVLTHCSHRSAYKTALNHEPHENSTCFWPTLNQSTRLILNSSTIWRTLHKTSDVKLDSSKMDRCQ